MNREGIRLILHRFTIHKLFTTKRLDVITFSILLSILDLRWHYKATLWSNPAKYHDVMRLANWYKLSL